MSNKDKLVLTAENVKELMSLLGVKGTSFTQEQWDGLNEFTRLLFVYDVVSIYFQCKGKTNE